MIDALLGILLFQLIGEVVSRGLNLPVPGPVVGMLLLFAILRWRGGPPEALSNTAHGILANLPLLFVPAGVGGDGSPALAGPRRSAFVGGNCGFDVNNVTDNRSHRPLAAPEKVMAHDG
ncbi:CidA/LrgA family protein [Chloroflexus islandicus]|uniref:CidA/LrgA family protein n=1 Tax=Chloroflexus islandicus TaxID=1707952 RepID=UPI000AC9E4E6|nr:CidA/LrgA family protein [Chloroflexus islandicus]